MSVSHKSDIPVASAAESDPLVGCTYVSMCTAVPSVPRTALLRWALIEMREIEIIDIEIRGM